MNIKKYQNIWQKFKIAAYYYFRPWQNAKRLKRTMKDSDFSYKEYDERKTNEKTKMP